MEANGPLIAMLAAIGICVVNTLAGFVVARTALGKDLNVFLALVFGSLGLRAMMVLAAAWFCLSIIGLHKVAFALTFAIVSFILLMVEILFFHRSYEENKRHVRHPVTDQLKKKVSDMIIGLRPSAEPCFA